MFDRVVIVDWSASSRPVRGRDSIWVAVRDAAGISTTNPPTRSAAMVHVEDLCRRPGRTLLGVDFSLGYPSGLAAVLGLDGIPWRATWTLLEHLVIDEDDNVNNRFDVAAELNARVGHGPGPFWGCPPNRRTATLTSTKVDPSPLDEWRTVEVELRRRGTRPFSSWQLLGVGSVGSQSLLGIPRLCRLERALLAVGRSVDVWPFTGGPHPAADVVIAEVWPSLHPVAETAGGRGGAQVRDEAQVIACARRLGDDVGFDAVDALDGHRRRIIEGEEGWTLGA